MNDIPADVVAAARLLTRYFGERLISDWKLDGCQARHDDAMMRDLVQELLPYAEREILHRQPNVYPAALALLARAERALSATSPRFARSSKA